MTIPSILYGLFLLSVVGLYWALEARSLRIWMLLIASLVFYTSLQVHYLPLMLVLVGVNFWFGRVLSAPADWRVRNEQWPVAEKAWHRRRRLWLGLGVGLNAREGRLRGVAQRVLVVAADHRDGLGHGQVRARTAVEHVLPAQVVGGHEARRPGQLRQPSRHPVLLLLPRAAAPAAPR